MGRLRSSHHPHPKVIFLDRSQGAWWHFLNRDVRNGFGRHLYHDGSRGYIKEYVSQTGAQPPSGWLVSSGVRVRRAVASKCADQQTAWPSAQMRDLAMRFAPWPRLSAASPLNCPSGAGALRACGARTMLTHSTVPWHRSQKGGGRGLELAGPQTQAPSSWSRRPQS